MKNLFEPAAAVEIINRIEKLQAAATPLWGKMNAAQMLAHCQAPFATYFGDMQSKRVLAGYLFGGIAKKQLFHDKPWRKNLPTAREFVVNDDRSFDAEKNVLVQLINRFATEGERMSDKMHPFFGNMSPREWARLCYRHTDHHLRQFGV